ncbi:MAG: flagellar hook-basal body complex protein, partial [Planctomycetota bacterium]
MASTTALFTGLTGLSTNARRLDVIGNNIANVNTHSFKANRMMVTPAFSLTMSGGTAPAATTGGTNPSQVGLGAVMAGTQRNLNNGSISSTGVPTDVAIEGEGYFIVNSAGEQMYTRAGAFQLNELNDMVTLEGGELMGYGVDAQFSVVTGALVPLNIPLGTMTLAEATQNVQFRGNLNAAGPTATTGSVHVNRTFYTDAALTPGMEPAANYDLTVPGNDIYIDDGAGGSSLAFEGGAGTIITVTGAEKAGKDLGEKTFAFSAVPVAGVDAYGQTIQDFVDFLDSTLGLDSSTIGGETLGGGISYAAGVMTITGNEGEDQALRLETANFVATNNGAGTNQPLVMSQTGEADGESVRTSYVVYDSLGSPITVDLTFVLQSTAPGLGTTWTFVAESSDADAVDRLVGLGTVQFDGNGDYVGASNTAFSVPRTNGAVSPLTVDMDFDSGADALRALATTNSTLAATFQDGSAVGTLSSFAIEQDG